MKKPSRTLTTFCLTVIDGDTIIVGDIGGNQAKVRLLGINAPEIGRPFYEGAKACLRHMAEGMEVIVEFDGSGYQNDRFGRRLAYVEVAGEDLGATLLKQGHACVFAGQEFRRRGSYVDLERRAREARLNIWSRG